MVPPELVTETVKLLAPALPILIMAGQEGVKEVGKKIGGLAADTGQKIWQWLKPHAEKAPDLLKAAEEVGASPDDQDAQGALRLHLRKLLEVQPHLIPELSELIKGVSSQRNTVDVSGDAAVGIGGNASGVIVTTHSTRNK